jgi:hypothetical protein
LPTGKHENLQKNASLTYHDSQMKNEKLTRNTCRSSRIKKSGLCPALVLIRVYVFWTVAEVIISDRILYISATSRPNTN